MQFITMGNLHTNNHVALIMIDHPARARLKIFAKAEIGEIKDDPELYRLLDLENYDFRPERVMVLHVEAYDWNCPQLITPRYTAEEIEEAFAPQRIYIAELEAQIHDVMIPTIRNFLDRKVGLAK